MGAKEQELILWDAKIDILGITETKKQEEKKLSEITSFCTLERVTSTCSQFTIEIEYDNTDWKLEICEFQDHVQTLRKEQSSAQIYCIHSKKFCSSYL